MAGELGIRLKSINLPGAAAVESRLGGVRKLEVSFARPVELIAPLELINLAGGGTIAPVSQVLSPDGRVITLQFDAGAVPDAACYQLDLAPAVVDVKTGLALEGPLAQMRVASLVGDVTGDGAVTLVDFMCVKSDVGRAVDGNSAHLDVNLDGQISLIDAQLVKSRVGNTATCGE